MSDDVQGPLLEVVANDFCFSLLSIFHLLAMKFALMDNKI
jgi:hypothetical protein